MIKIISIALFLLPVFISEHDIHVSTCEIYKAGPNKIEVVFKVFYDDLQLAMGLHPGEELPQDYKGSDLLINDFLKKYTTFTINGKSPSWEYKSSKAALPAIWTTIELTYEPLKTPQVLEITNSILIDTYSDQINIIHSYIPNERKMVSLDKKKNVLKINI